jgi:molybdate transport system substrate-binding protein
VYKGLLLSLLLSVGVYANTITIAVSANVSYAIEELIEVFRETHIDTKVRVVLGGSGKLTAQIQNHAPYQLFMSADMLYPDSLYKSGIAITKPTIYAKGSLALLSGKKRDFSRGLEILKDKDIAKISIANPKTAPYGRATVEALKSAKIYRGIKDKFIYSESISQSVAYTITATDIGVIAKSSLFSPKMRRFREGINWIEIDPSLYKAIEQGVVILKNAKNNKEVRSFYDFLYSPKAKEIFHKFGYSTL